MDDSMKENLEVRPTRSMDKTEKAYITSRGKASSAVEAVRRARKANKKPPIPEE